MAIGIGCKHGMAYLAKCRTGDGGGVRLTRSSGLRAADD